MIVSYIEADAIEGLKINHTVFFMITGIKIMRLGLDAGFDDNINIAIVEYILNGDKKDVRVPISTEIDSTTLTFYLWLLKTILPQIAKQL